MEPLEISQIIRRNRSRFPNLNQPAGGIHLWLLALPADDASRRACHEVLTADEQDRAGRIILGLPRDQFVFTRAALRSILSGYLGTGDATFSIATGPHGKPRLVAAKATAMPAFNVSHSGKLALLAFRESGEVGADIEHRRPLANLMDVAGMAFSQDELAFLASREGSERLNTFYTIWTCKEALLKAEGLGMARDPKSLCLFAGNLPAAKLGVSFSTGEFTVRWSLDVPGYALAWATEKRAPAVPRWIGSTDLD
jgi:4'-phosphopantetheinyl transferase